METPTSDRTNSPENTGGIIAKCQGRACHVHVMFLTSSVSERITAQEARNVAAALMRAADSAQKNAESRNLDLPLQFGSVLKNLELSLS